mgnify:CR=1 FL=1
MLAGQEEIYLSFVEICFFCNFFGLRAIYKIEREKQRREEIRMKKDLYDHITAYIVENQNKFYRLAYSYVQNREDALDAVQNAVCKALEHYGKIRNEDAIKTWFYRILVNESLLLLKAKSRISLEDENTEEASYEEKGFEVQDDLYDCINRLDEDTQTIIKLRFFEEMPLKEISQVMEMNLNTVKARLYRGLQQLKVNIQEVEQ